MAEIDIGSSIFECGQTYVALSRVQTLEGLYLCSFQPDKIKVHPKVKTFYETVPVVEYEESEESERESIRDNNSDIKKITLDNELSFDTYAYDEEENTKTIYKSLNLAL